jgi:hypothetical protein
VIDNAAVGAIRKEIAMIDALCNSSSEGVIAALELSVDLSKPSGDILNEAYNAMCEEQRGDLDLQVRASQGPLTQLALQALTNQNEEKEGKKHLFLEALMFVKLLLETWAPEDVAHMETKLQIATTLLEKGVLTALLGQFTFWVVQWNFAYGDCGDPAMISVLYLARYFPHLINGQILPNANAVAFIRHVAQQHRANPTHSGGNFETGFTAGAALEALLDGLPEPPRGENPGFGF